MATPKKTVKRQRDPVAKVHFKRRSKVDIRNKKATVEGIRCTFNNAK